MSKIKESVVTFSCSKSIHVYQNKTSLTPAPPCKFHVSIEAAKEALKLRGINDPKIITNA